MKWLVLATAFLIACPSTGNEVTPETTELPFEHPQAPAACIADFQSCYRDCENTHDWRYDYSASGNVGTPNTIRIFDCQTNCERKFPCMPWLIGVPSGPPCRVTGDRYECNAYLCSRAAGECLDDCFKVYGLTNPLGPVALEVCNEGCYEYYGCRPRLNDPCDPLPDGYINCACPDLHGVQCHPPDGRSCL